MPNDLAMKANLITMYSTPGRVYHTFQHIQHCFRELHQLREDISLDPTQAVIAEFAIWFHDAVYDPKQTGGINERDSAYLAHSYLYTHPMHEYRAMATPVGLAIEATASHMYPQNLTLGGDYFLDIDLSILGQSPATYKTYATAIRDEYEWVPPATYQAGREKVLKEFLAATNIYRTKYFQNKYETTARENIQWELNRLHSVR